MTFKNKYLLVRLLDDLDQVLFTCEIELKPYKNRYYLTIPEETLVKGAYKLNSIIYQPAVAQYDNIKESCGFYVLDNNNTFSHLETFDIGKIYVPQNWLK